MIRTTITKHGVTEQNDILEQDFEDARVLLALPGWDRYFVRKLEKRHAELIYSLITLESNDISEFKKLQAKIELIQEIKAIPAIDFKNLGR